MVRDGNVRNIQISGCDIEANMPGDSTETSTANVLLDVSSSPGNRKKSIAEVSITGCTIQHSANYSGEETKTLAPGGSNIRIVGKEIYPVDSVTISGNVLSDTTTHIDLTHVMEVTITANNFFAPKPANLEVTDSRRVVVSGNTFNPRQFSRPGTIRFTNTHDSILSGSTLHRFETAEGAVILDGCTGFTLNALNFSDCGSGILMSNCKGVTISACRIARTTEGGFDLSAKDKNQDLLLSGNVFSGKVEVPTSVTE